MKLLLAGTVERWDMDSLRSVQEVSAHSTDVADSVWKAPLRLSVRLVSKATGRVAWRKTEDCSHSSSGPASIADSAKASSSGWTADFERCREEVLRACARDVSQAALDLARKAAISEAAARADH